MKCRLVAATLVVAGLALAGCRDRPTAPSHTAVLGGYGNVPAPSEPPLTDAHGQPVPRPPAPAGTPVQVVHADSDTVLASWVQDGRVVVSRFARPGGWSEARPLEEIYGVASDPQLASDGKGSALAVWRHTVGSIQSLRFSRFESASGWSAPDVLPGALPRPHAAGAARDEDAPRLSVDAAGVITARWPSGFAPREEQVARYTPGQGWSPAASEQVASAAPARPAPSAAR